MSATCRSCDRPVRAPRVERAKLVWVCSRCADRTEVACDACGTPLSEPRKYADGFRAWCKPCGAVVRLDRTATTQRRTVEQAAPPPGPSEPPPEEPVAPVRERVDVAPDATLAKSQALEITTEAATGANYRGADRAVRIVCKPRPVDATLDFGLLARRAVAAVVGAAAVSFAATLVLSALEVSMSFAMQALVFALSGAVFQIVLWPARVEQPTNVTRVRAGADGLEVERDGQPGWRVDAPRVSRVFAVDDADGVARVRVELDDGTEQEVVAGLTEDEAHEVVDQLDRALPGRQATRRR